MADIANLQAPLMGLTGEEHEAPPTIFKRWTSDQWADHVLKTWTTELTKGRVLTSTEDKTLRHLVKYAIEGAISQSKDPQFV